MNVKSVALRKLSVSSMGAGGISCVPSVRYGLLALVKGAVPELGKTPSVLRLAGQSTSSQERIECRAK
uniref:Uncharacterized protein n=1 Tax=Romanomermis culicivorax TaxID=13658 RepID=A0A915I921_ROMCU